MSHKKAAIILLIALFSTAAAADTSWMHYYKGTLNNRVSLIEVNGIFLPTGLQQFDADDEDTSEAPKKPHIQEPAKPDPNYPTECDKELMGEFSEAAREVIKGVSRDRVEAYNRDIEQLEKEIQEQTDENEKARRRAAIDEIKLRLSDVRKGGFWNDWICYGFGDFYTIEACIYRLTQKGYPYANAELICGDCSNVYKKNCFDKGWVQRDIYDVMVGLNLPWDVIDRKMEEWDKQQEEKRKAEEEKKKQEKKEVGYIIPPEEEGLFTDQRCSVAIGQDAGRPQCLREYCIKIKGGTQPRWECQVPGGMSAKTGKPLERPRPPVVTPRPPVIEESPTIPIEMIVTTPDLPDVKVTIPRVPPSGIPEPAPLPPPGAPPLDCSQKFPGMELLNVRSQSECQSLANFEAMPNKQICHNYRIEVKFASRGNDMCCARKVTATQIPGCTAANWGGWTSTGTGVVQPQVQITPVTPLPSSVTPTTPLIPTAPRAIGTY